MRQAEYISVSFRLNPESKRQLDAISEHDRRTLLATVEWLIEQRYQAIANEPKPAHNASSP